MTRLDGKAGTPAVDDHPFRAPLGEPWGLCTAQGCGMAESAHTGAVPGGSYAEHLAAHPPAEPLHVAHAPGVVRADCPACVRGATS